MTRLARISACVLLSWTPASASALAQGYIDGVFVGTTDGPVELIAWAEMSRNGTVRMIQGALDDVPTVPDVYRILTNLPNWKAAAILFTSEAIFRDDRAERRELPFAVRRIDISAVEIRVADIERRDGIARLLRIVRASDDNPGYVFIAVTTDGMVRLYPFRVRMK